MNGTIINFRSPTVTSLTMTKTEAILANKRASSRLKPVADTVLKFANGQVSRPIAKEKQRMEARLDRELTDKDEQAKELRQAVEAFWWAYERDAEREVLMARFADVARLTQAIKSARWRRIEAQPGPIKHYQARKAIESKQT
jgi:hypothetical protein